MRLALVALAVALLTACSGETVPSPTPTVAGGVPGLVEALRSAGLEARQAGTFNALLGGRGVELCVAGETLNLMVDQSPEAAAAAAAQVNPRDPSMIGNAIVDWVGPPTFWRHDTLIVYYIGSSERIREALLEVLGAPFAVAQGVLRVDLPGC